MMGFMFTLLEFEGFLFFFREVDGIPLYLKLPEFRIGLSLSLSRLHAFRTWTSWSNHSASVFENFVVILIVCNALARSKTRERASELARPWSPW